MLKTAMSRSSRPFTDHERAGGLSSGWAFGNKSQDQLSSKQERVCCSTRKQFSTFFSLPYALFRPSLNKKSRLSMSGSALRSSSGIFCSCPGEPSIKEKRWNILGARVVSSFQHNRFSVPSVHLQDSMMHCDPWSLTLSKISLMVSHSEQYVARIVGKNPREAEGRIA